MSEPDDVCQSVLTKIEKSLAQMKLMSLIPFPVYENTNKAGAYISYRLKRYESVAFYLSEAHGGGIRSKLTLTVNPDISCEKELDDCLSLDSEYVSKGYLGLIDRLKKMPSEWTLIQITRNYNPKETVTPRHSDKPTEMCELFITRYQCGEKYKNIVPLTIKVSKPKSCSGQKTIFEVLKKSLEDTNDRENKNQATIRNLRDSASQSIEVISQEIQSGWLKHWIFMLLGNYVDENLGASVYNTIDTVIEQNNITISTRDRMMLYQITNAAVQLTEADIHNLLSEVNCLAEERSQFDLAICNYRFNGSHLMLKKRHPILLILDEHLECLPWETIPCLKRHPVSRISSIHIAHRLYTKHKNSIENGLMKIKNQGYYVLNPDKTLSNAEKRISNFLKERDVHWKGILSEEPTSEQFSSLLKQNDILLYCGHGNGTQYLHSLELDKLDLHCIPMLFGCSSAKHTDRGGRANFVGASYGYLKAGCPSVIGMLWNVTSLDVDNLARAMLNVWLPGNPINLQKMWPKEFLDDVDFHKERELLRTLAIARKTTRSFFNCAALIARGIPVIMTEE